MLNHMELQQQFGQHMQRRCQRQKEREQGGLEGDQAPGAAALWNPPVELAPTAQVDGADEQQRDDNPGLKSTGLKYGGGYRICTRRATKRRVGVSEYCSVVF